MTIDNSKIIKITSILSKSIEHKLKLIKITNDITCEFVKLKDLIELINKNIFDNKLNNLAILNMLYRNIYKKCNKLYLIDEQIIENINNYDIIQISYKNKFYNYTTIKIKIKEYLINSNSPHHVKFKKILKGSYNEN